MKTCVASTRSNDLCGSRKPAIGGLIGLPAAGEGISARLDREKLAGLAGDPIGQETRSLEKPKLSNTGMAKSAVAGNQVGIAANRISSPASDLLKKRTKINRA
jgi:hypothetical protein